MPVNPDQLELVLAKIRKAYGDSEIHYGNDYPPLERIPTGSLELDLATGGGIPIGRFCHFYGPTYSSKTLLGWNIIQRAQELGLDVAYYNIEKQFLPDWVERHGIDLNKLHVI